MKNIFIKDFKYGLINSIEENSLPRGASSKSLNFITSGVKIELRRGYTLLGTTENSGVGRITGLGIGKKPDGTDIVYRTRKRKIEYLDTTTDDWVEVGTNTMSADVIATDSLGEDISIEPYTNPTGSQIWFNSRNCGPLKIMTANPGSITNMYVAGTNVKGYMRIKQSRMWAWNTNSIPPDKTSLFASQFDSQATTDYTQISAEVIAGASGTLAFKAAGARRICFGTTFTVTAGGEVFTDNGDGTLTGSLGSSGTINYTSGAYTGVGAGTCTYRWADDSAVKGIANFAYSATRVAGEGFIMSQALGGNFQNLMSLNGKEYCLHKNTVWLVSDFGTDDDTFSNLIYRSRIGIPNHRAACESGDGIYFIDDTDENDVHFRILRIESGGTEIVPLSISKQFKIADVKVGVNLNDYRFDKAASIEFGDYILFACRTSDSTTNNRVFLYNKINKATDILNYFVSCFAIYDGTLVAGDSITDNVYTLFSGTDDNNDQINGYWESNLDNMGFDGLKKTVEITVEGDIGPDQSAKLSISIDRSNFTEIRSASDVSSIDTPATTALTLLDSYSESNANDYIAAYTSSFYIFGQCFTNASSAVLDSIKFYLKKAGTPTGSAYAKVYAVTGTYGTNATPTGSALATSDAFDISTLTTSPGLVTFSFSAANQITLSASTNYFITIESNNGSFLNNVLVGYDTSSPSHGGNFVYSSDGLAWTATSLYDCIFYIYGTTIVPATYKSVNAIMGDGPYVDRSQSVAVGAFTLGRGEVGGGGDGLTAYHYRRTFRVQLSKFEFIKFRVEPTGVGYFSLTEFTYRDIRVKSSKVPSRYRTTR